MGIWELVLVALIILVVAGPERLPVIMRTIGHWVGRGRATLKGLQAELEREGRSLESDLDLKKPDEREDSRRE